MGRTVHRDGQRVAKERRRWVKSALDAVLFGETLVACKVFVGGFSQELSALTSDSGASRSHRDEVG